MTFVTMPDEVEDEFTELVGYRGNRADLVRASANGVPRFLVMKQDEGAAGLLDPEFVRSLIGKQADPEPETGGMVTMTATPAAMAEMLARVRKGTPNEDVAKAELSGKSRNDLPDSAFGYIEPGGKKDESGKTTPRSLRHFPLNDEAHVRAALQDAPKSPFGDKAMPKIRAAAKREGIEVSKEAGVPDTVTKDMGPELDDGVDGLDPTIPLAAPDEMGAGDPADPGSPAWESIDAATAQKWLSILARAKNAIGLLAEREFTEAIVADPDDACAGYSLEDAACQLDYVISALAVFAAGEQAQADICAEMEGIAKAMTSADLAGPLAVLETFGTIVRKSGRVLSAVNEAHLREAHARLNTVLSSLPQAPATDDGQPVAKMTPETEASMPDPTPSEDATAASGQQPAMGAREGTVAKAADSTPEPAGDALGAPVAKSALALVYDRTGSLVGVTDAASIATRVAKADDGEKKPMQAVFDQDGDLIGIVDPDAIQPVTGAGGKPAPDDGAAPDAPAADDGDMTPQPPADAGTPAGADDGTVAKSHEQDPDTRTVLKSIVTEALAELIGAQVPHEGVAKQADVAAANARLDEMLARLETVEKQDAKPGVFANGAVPPPGSVPPSRPSLRGQDQGAPVDVAKAAQLKQTLYHGTAPEQAEAFRDMEQLAVARLQDIHGRRAPA